MLVRLLLVVVMSVLPPVSQAMQEGLGGDGWLVPWVTFLDAHLKSLYCSVTY